MAEPAALGAPIDTDDPNTIPDYVEFLQRDALAVPDLFFERGDEISTPTHKVDTAHYISGEFFDREATGLWSRVWQVACRENDIPEVGDFVEYQIVDRSVIIVRDAPDSISAFHNACRHRGTAVASGCGHATEFNCPFHSWRYHLDGSLKHVPCRWDFPEVTDAEYGLLPVRAETWDGWVFVNLDPDAEPLRDFLGDVVPRHFEQFPRSEMWKAWHLGMVVDCNWKATVEAFMETYHIARTHPTLVAHSSDVFTQYDTFGLHARLLQPNGVPCQQPGVEYTPAEIVASMVNLSTPQGDGDEQENDGGYVTTARFGAGARTSDEAEIAADADVRQLVAARRREAARESGIDMSDACDAEVLDSIEYFVFPNFFPWGGRSGGLAYRMRPWGPNPETMLFEILLLVPLPGGTPRPQDSPLRILAPGETFDDMRDQMAQLFLLDQDMSNLPRVQRGMHSLDHVMFADRQERNIIAFHPNLEGFLDGSPRRGGADGR